MRNRDQAFPAAGHVVLTHRDLDVHETGLVRCLIRDDLVAFASQHTAAVENLPREFEVALDPPSRAVARQCPDLLALTYPHDERGRRYRHAEQRSRKGEELALFGFA